MQLKTTLLFSLLFLILLVGFLYYAFPNILYHPRIDPIPAGAYIVPWMSPNPSIPSLLSIPLDQLPWNLDTAMTGALRLDVTFRIPVPGQPRTVPSTVYLGHDSEYLYIGGSISGIGPDPNSNAQAGYPDYFSTKFDVANSGVLTFPEAGSTLAVDVSPPGAKPLPHGWDSPLFWLYEDDVWVNYIKAIGRAAWDYADNYVSVSTLGIMAAEYDNSTGTLVVIFSRHLWNAGYFANSLQMSPGERWVMGFTLELGLSNFAGSAPYTDYVDGWPRNTFPYLSNDSSWWPKLVIDLTKPPATFPGQTPAGTNA